MTEEMRAELEAATRAFRRAEKAAKDRRTELYALIRRAADAGIIQADIARVTGYTRERIRLLTRDDAEPAGHDPVS